MKLVWIEKFEHLPYGLSTRSGFAKNSKDVSLSLR